MRYFVTGTDTDCGKTYFTALAVRALKRSGVDAVGLKPVCCGPRDDVEALRAACEGRLTADEINPIWMRHAAAPLACEMLGEPRPDYAEALRRVKETAARFPAVLVEGAGGWLVPLTEELSVADMAAALALPVLIVARNRLGMLNHALLTVESVRGRGLAVAGFVLNDCDGTGDEARATNRRVLERATDVPVLFELAPGQRDLPAVAGVSSAA